MTLESLIAFNIALIAAMASPGPAMLMAVRASLAGGLPSGIATGVGLGVVATGWLVLAFLGVEGLFRLFPWAYGAPKIGGALYLMWLAWKTWSGAGALPEGPRGTAGVLRAARAGALVNLANPKSVLFAAAVIAVVFPPDLSPLAKAVVALNQLVVEIVVYAALAASLSRPRVRAAYLDARRVIDRGVAVVLGGLGLRLIVDSRP